MNTLRRSLQQLFSVCVVAGVFGWVGTPRAQAQATAPFYEPFNYPAGNLVGNSINGSTWAAISTSDSVYVQVTAGSLSYPGLPSPQGGKVVLGNGNGYQDVVLPITSLSSGSIYASFLLNVVNPGNTSGDYFFFVSAPTGTIYNTRVYVKQGSSSSKFKLGLAQSGGTPVYTANEYDTNTTFLIAVAYTFVDGATNNDTASLWINPQLGQSSPPAVDLGSFTGTGDSTSVARIGLRQGSGDTNLNLQVDELRVSTSWSDVTLLPVTLSSWAVE